MCGGSSHQAFNHLPSNKHCCPEGQVFVEEICGNLRAPIDQDVWVAPTPFSDYVQGTFTVFNSGNTPFLISANGVLPATTVPPGNTVSLSVNNPTRFTVTLDNGDKGEYCIKLYKRLFV